MSYLNIAQKNIICGGFIRHHRNMKDETKLAANLSKLREKLKDKEIKKWGKNFLLNENTIKGDPFRKEIQDYAKNHMQNLYEIFCKTNNCEITYDNFVKLVYQSSNIINLVPHAQQLLREKQN